MSRKSPLINHMIFVNIFDILDFDKEHELWINWDDKYIDDFYSVREQLLAEWLGLDEVK